MPTFRHGKTTRVFFGGYELTTFLRSANVPRTVDTAETTGFTAPVKTYVVGQQSASMSFEGMFCHDPIGEADLNDVIEDHMNLEEPVPAAVCYDGAATAGKTVQAGLAHRTNVSVTGSVSDIVGMNIDMQLTDTSGLGMILVGQEGTWDFSDAEDDLSSLLVLEETEFVNGGYVAVHILDGSDITTGIELSFDHSLNGGVDWTSLHTWSPDDEVHQFYSAHIPGPIGPDVRFSASDINGSEADVVAYFVPKYS